MVHADSGLELKSSTMRYLMRPPEPPHVVSSGLNFASSPPPVADPSLSPISEDSDSDGELLAEGGVVV
jgi:hypothetical protein